MTTQAKTDESQIKSLYREMYKAMVAKDTVTLNRVHADDFVLTHMTGMHQSKQEYIKAIAGGTLNYYSARASTYSAIVSSRPCLSYLSNTAAFILLLYMLCAYRL